MAWNEDVDAFLATHRSSPATQYPCLLDDLAT